MADPKVIDRIKKLWALSSSPNVHEAESALERARSLMAQHHVTEADISEVVIGEADDRRDPYRDELARVVAISRGCQAVTRKDRIGFRGRRTAIEEATPLYQELCRGADDGAVSTACQDPEACSDSVAMRAWTGCYWMGFLQSITERFIEQLLGRPYKSPTSGQGEPAISSTQLAALDETVGSLVDLANERAEEDQLMARITAFRRRAIEAGITRALTWPLRAPTVNRLQLAR